MRTAVPSAVAGTFVFASFLLLRLSLQLPSPIIIWLLHTIKTARPLSSTGTTRTRKEQSHVLRPHDANRWALNGPLWGTRPEWKQTNING
ncbi:hypothetical protein QR685DRAFT_119615 [Neurospora intermedia]|uniref:Secreted protein n=1 Tax=Neurospora intermedia TaxID=5142 RepID=A0ABR3D081_NEUIN